MGNPVVDLPAGAIRGSALRGVEAFLGIPYAAPPVGLLRWCAPRPAARWEAVRDATELGPAPPQPARAINIWYHGALGETSEDCLTLNAWRPAGADGLPVFVWLHGGGGTYGWAGSEVFDGSALALALDAVVVTLNYRLGSLGWLYDPSFEPPHGDWATLDAAAALRWLQENAPALGGDPAAVTLCGFSAGANITCELLTSPVGEGLFARALPMSPAMGEQVIELEVSAAWTRALLEELGVADVAAARAVRAERIVEAHEALLTPGGVRSTRGGARPIVLPGAIEVDPFLAPERRIETPVMIGAAADEASIITSFPGRRIDPSEAELRAAVAAQRDVEDADKVIADAGAAHPGADGNELLRRILTEQMFVGPIMRWAEQRAAAGGEVYRYVVELESPVEGLGAVHGIESPLLFGTHRTTEAGAEISGTDVRADEASAAIQRAVRAFVHGEPPWPAGETGRF